MNGKRKLVVVVLFLMMMVTAVAYAAWSDTIEVDGTVTTGDFDVHWKDPSVTATVTGVGTTTAEGIVTATRDTTDLTEDSYTIAVTNAKPGEVYTVQLTAENLGSLEALRQSMTLASGTESVTKTGTGANQLYLDVTSTALSLQTTRFVIEATSTASGILAKSADGTGGGQETFTIKVTVPSDNDNDINERTEGYDDVANSITFDFDVVYAQRGFTSVVPAPTDPDPEL